MKSAHELDANRSQPAAPVEKLTSPDATAAAPPRATERDELSDEQIATITAGTGVGATGGVKPPPLHVTH